MPETTQTQTAWPEGVIARYLTVGGATVDLADDSHAGYVTAICTGERCGWQERTETHGMVYDTPEKTKVRVERALPRAQAYAQDHAAACRAMPRPTA